MSKLNPKKVRAYLLQIVTKDELGRPTGCVLRYDDNTVEIKQGMEFITVWVDPDMVLPHPKTRA